MKDTVFVSLLPTGILDLKRRIMKAVALVTRDTLVKAWEEL
jgi:hypothetical protein